MPMIIRSGSSTVKKFFLITVVFLFAIGSFLGGFILGQKNIPIQLGQTGGNVVDTNAPPPYLLKDVDFNLFWQVWKIVQDKYVDQPVKDTELFYGALEGIVSSLDDPHSVFLDPALMKKFEEELTGQFDGIGAELAIKNKELVIIAPLPSSPAEKAGLRARDWIVKINGEETGNMSIEEAVSKIRGKKGTSVTLTIFRDGFTEPKDFTIVRDLIHVMSVQYEQKGEIAYIKILDFDEQSSQYFKDAVQKAFRQNPKGIILDLRNNPGGLLDSGIEVASEWLTKGEVVVGEEGANGQNDQFTTDRDGVFKEIPTVVLVNEGSASASEIVAGALQDFGRAKLVGKKTFGKGSVQELENLPDGSAVKITVARWLTPKGRQINEVGIAPDVEVELTEKDFANDLDPQLDKALELLGQKPSP